MVQGKTSKSDFDLREVQERGAPAGQTPAEFREEKKQAAHDNQVRAEKELAEASPQSNAGGNEPAKAGTTYPKDGRGSEVGEVEFYQAGTAGDQADPSKVYESKNPANNPNLVSKEDQEAARKAADETRVKDVRTRSDHKFEAKAGGASEEEANKAADKAVGKTDSGNKDQLAGEPAKTSNSGSGSRNNSSNTTSASK